MASSNEYILPNSQAVVELDSEVAFNALTDKEKLYAHYMSRASWNGALIILLQTSPESPFIFTLLHKIFSCEPLDELKKKALEKLSEDEFKAFIVYACGLFGNLGNYKSFGDTKFVPNLPQELFEYVVKESNAYKSDEKSMDELWNQCKHPLYNLSDNVRSLGYPSKGLTTYFSSNFTMEDVNNVNQFLKELRMEAYNTRAVKVKNTPESGNLPYINQILVASEVKELSELMQSKNMEGSLYQIVKGDYSPLLKATNKYLNLAKEYAANDYEREMLNEYVKHFSTGLLDDHKNGSRYWIKNKGPIVETYIGFIETYRDPNGARGEFEGFVAIVNKEMTKKFSHLVNQAESFLTQLPWPTEFEKDKFQKPDFTSLDVLTFASGGIPCGINIPNYDDVRQNDGFKNVSLGNIIPSGFKDSPLPFLSPEDRELVIKHAVTAFEMQVGLHELLGHGSGKLFHCVNGVYDFDEKKVTNPLDGSPINSWYEEGETYDSVFASLGSAFEECRAECVGLYLSLFPEIASIFVKDEKDIPDVTYVNWLLLLNSGAEKALEMYSPSTESWLQAHCQARFLITNVLLHAPEEFIFIEEPEQDKRLRLTVDRSKLNSVGKEALRDLLLKLQVYKSTANIEAAKQLFDEYSAVVNKGKYDWLRWRNIVMALKQPRKIFVQPNTIIEDGKVKLKRYEATLEGLIKSWVERYEQEEDCIYGPLLSLATNDQKYFNNY